MALLVYPFNEDSPTFSLRLQVRVIEVSLMLTTTGLEGGPGKVEGSGDRWKLTLGLCGDSTVREAVQEVSPLSLDAVQVYIPLSRICKPRNWIKKSITMCLREDLFYIRNIIYRTPNKSLFDQKHSWQVECTMQQTPEFWTFRMVVESTKISRKMHITAALSSPPRT